MLRTLGASRRFVFQGVAAEFTALGMLAGLLAAAGRDDRRWLLAREVFDLKYAPGVGVWIIGVVGGATLVGVAGVLAARSVVTHPPVETLRQRRFDTAWTGQAAVLDDEDAATRRRCADRATCSPAAGSGTRQVRTRSKLQRHAQVSGSSRARGAAGPACVPGRPCRS
jgi:hypothetical protein